jgi:hypothetical protein
MSHLLQTNVEKRISAESALDHPYVVNWKREADLNGALMQEFEWLEGTLEEEEAAKGRDCGMEFKSF